jgi:hypothetical protein
VTKDICVYTNKGGVSKLIHHDSTPHYLTTGRQSDEPRTRRMLLPVSPNWLFSEALCGMNRSCPQCSALTRCPAGNSPRALNTVHASCLDQDGSRFQNYHVGGLGVRHSISFCLHSQTSPPAWGLSMRSRIVLFSLRACPPIAPLGRKELRCSS